MTKWLIPVLIAALAYLQYRLWFDEGSYRQLQMLEAQIAEQASENARLLERNRLLAAEVEALKQENAAVEERARTDLGMIKEGETFFMVVPQKPAARNQANSK